MSILSHSLVTVAELKDEINITGSGRDATIEEIANRVTALIEGHLDRKIIERVAGTVAVSYTEYHSIDRTVEDIYLREWPVVSITSVQEIQTWPATYATTLAGNTGYFLDAKASRLTRIDSTGVSYWAIGRRSVKVVYRGGYSTLAEVPYEIRDVARRLGATLYKEVDRGQQGISGYSDSIGNFTRFGAAKLTDDMKEVLALYRRPSYDPTGVEVA